VLAACLDPPLACPGGWIATSMAHPAWMCPLVLSCSLPLQLSASSGRPRRQGRAAAADCCALPACCRCSGLNVCIQQGVVQGAGCDDKPPLGGQVRVARQRDHQQRLSPQHPCCPTPQTWLGIVGALSMLFQARPDMRLPLGPPPQTPPCARGCSWTSSSWTTAPACRRSRRWRDAPSSSG
jgi:hypothetical protein